MPWEIAHVGVIFPELIYYQLYPEFGLLSYLGIIINVVYFVGILVNHKRQTICYKITHIVVSQNNQ